MQRTIKATLLMASLLAPAACDQSGITDPTETGPLPQDALFHRDIPLSELQEAAQSEVMRVEVKVLSGGSPLVARRVEREESEAIQEEERIESRITELFEGGMILSLGELRVDFGPDTRFEAEGGTTLSQEEFIARVQAILDAGGQPGVEAKRSPDASPQAPDDASFVAEKVELDDDANRGELQLNIDADNLIVNNTPPPAALLQVLGLTIEIRTNETRIRARREDLGEKVNFEDLIISADADAGTFVLNDGREIHLIPGATEIDADDDDELGSLADVVNALLEEQLVEADGKGVIQDGRLLALEVEFGVEEPGDVPGAVEYEGMIASIDADAGTFELTDGRFFQLESNSKIKLDDGFASLADVQTAVDAGHQIKAEGEALLDTSGSEPIHRVLEVEIEDESEGGDDFESTVASVTLNGETGSITLEDKRTIRIDDVAVIDTEGDLTTLQAVSDALDEGIVVKVQGNTTTVEGELVATRIKFETDTGDGT